LVANIPVVLPFTVFKAQAKIGSRLDELLADIGLPALLPDAPSVTNPSSQQG
jgi:hypothetical protein